MGGLTFMVNDKMCVGIIKEELMARLDPDISETVLSNENCRRMDFTGKPLKGFYCPHGSIVTHRRARSSTAATAAMLWHVLYCYTLVWAFDEKDAQTYEIFHFCEHISGWSSVRRAVRLILWRVCSTELNSFWKIINLSQFKRPLFSGIQRDRKCRVIY